MIGSCHHIQCIIGRGGDRGAGAGQGFKFLIIINTTNLRTLFKLYLRSKPPSYTVITLLRNPTGKINKLNYLVGL